MRVTVLGSAASHAGEGQACAGHLVQGGGSSVLFDCGNGVIGNLYKVMSPSRLDGVFITHNHPDHYADIYSLHALLRYAPTGPTDPIPVYMAPSLYERMQLLLSERGSREFRAAFPLNPLEHGVPVEVGGLSVTPLLVDHTDPTFALVARADGAAIAYSSDTLPGDRARAMASGADLLLAEATLPDSYVGGSPHLNAHQAGELASDAGVGMLVLVHVWPSNDREEMLRDAAAAFGGPIHVARELDFWDIPGPEME